MTSVATFAVGRLVLGAPSTPLSEPLGDAVGSQGGAVVPAARTAPQFQVALATYLVANPSVAQGQVLRRALRSLLNNSPLKFQGFLYIVYSDDTEQNGWYVPDASSLSAIDKGSWKAVGLWQTGTGNWLLSGRRRTHREGREVWMKDLRTGLYARDQLGVIVSTDFSALPSLQLTVLPNGASNPVVTVSGQVLAPVALPAGRDGGVCQLVSGQSDMTVISYERAESALNLSDVIVYDRRGQLTGSSVSDPTTSVLLDGASGYVSTAYSPFVAGGSQTFGGWAQSSSNPSGSWLLGSSGTFQPQLYFNSATNLSWYPRNGAHADWVAAWPGNGQWVFWTLTWNDATKTAELFINSVSQGAHTITDAYGVGPNNIGWGGPLAFFPGNEEYDFVCNAILTAAQIAALYNATNFRQSLLALPSLVSCWPLGEASGTVAADIKGTNTGTYVGGVTLGQPGAPVTADGPSITGPDTLWEEVYGPDYPWNWTTGGANDCPVLDNGLVRVRYDGTNTPGFRVDVWNGAAYVEQGKMIVERSGDLFGPCNTWQSAVLAEYTPDRAVATVVLSNSSDSASQEHVYITVQRGELGVTFECYPALRAASQGDAYFVWQPALSSGNADAVDAAFKSDTQTLPTPQGTGALSASPVGGSGGTWGSATLGSSSFASSENYVALLREPTAVGTISPYQAALVPLQAANALAPIGNANLAYGSSDGAVALESQGPAGYLQAQLSFAPTQSDQVAQASTFRNASGTTSQNADANAYNGQNVKDTQTAQTNATCTKTSNLLQAKYRAFIRVKVDNPATGSFQVKLGTVGSYTVTTTSTTYVVLDLGDILATGINPTLAAYGWRSSGASGSVYIDRVWLFLVEDRTRGSAIYSGCRDAGKSALQDSRTLGALTARR